MLRIVRPNPSIWINPIVVSEFPVGRFDDMRRSVSLASSQLRPPKRRLGVIEWHFGTSGYAESDSNTPRGVAKGCDET